MQITNRQHILVIDQGTHATRALLFSPQGEILAQAQQTVSLHRIDHEQVEQDAEEIFNSVLHVLGEIGPLPASTVCALTTQRSTTLAWNKTTGAALCPALSWQDRRANKDLQPFSAHAGQIKNITGLPLSAHYGAGKLRWLLAHNQNVQNAAQQNNLCMGPLASFLLWRLLAAHLFCVDVSNAHRMLLLDLQTDNWSETLLQLFQLDKKYLPSCLPLQHHYGFLHHAKVPLVTVCGDQTAAFHGLGPLTPGTAVVNIGTGAFILAACDKVITDTPLLCGLRAGGWLLEGTVNGAGAALEWAQQQWPVENLFDQLPQWLNDENTPPVFINTVGGLGSPWWCSGVDAYFVEAGVTSTPLSPTLSHKGRGSERYVAIIESIVFLL
ncbi:MAG TPA: FGGY family carbohydrate kinase, partial [Gammaproteobacteria bacterium]|nr:FGGY family carbohydrate kinase [Gammaproteobacteria bacterium]